MARQPVHHKEPRPLFRVGDRVRFHFGTTTPIGTIVEDRGVIASGGHRLYRVRFVFDLSEVMFTEMREDELEPAE